MAWLFNLFHLANVAQHKQETREGPRSAERVVQQPNDLQNQRAS